MINHAEVIDEQGREIDELRTDNSILRHALEDSINILLHPDSKSPVSEAISTMQHALAICKN